METLNRDKIYNILYKRHKEGFLGLKDLPNPNSFKDMKKASKRIFEAIKAKERIALIGDYDVDGVVATTIIRELFDRLNYPLEWIIPNRFSDGYGISESIINRVDANLIITVDNGIVAFDAAKLCKERGIDLIITDHHSIGDKLPIAKAIVNQKQEDCNFKYKEICGAQIAWYLAISVAKEAGVKLNAKEFLDLVALAIVADIMPLTHINRAMLIAGLQQMEISNRAFVKAIKSQLGFKTITSEIIGYYLAPLINSAGRLKDASIACEFLYTKDIDRANTILSELIVLNQERKELEKDITQRAIKQVDKNDSIAIVWGEDWNEGVVGIVASRVVNHFKMPAIVLSCKDGICKGSGRSYGDCDLFHLVSQAKDLYIKFGGHKMAIGFSFKKEHLHLIKSIIKLEAKDCNQGYIDRDILGILPFSEIDFNLLNTLKLFEPYGEGNPKPKFLAKGVEVIQYYQIGKSKEHLKYILRGEGKIFTALKFHAKERDRVKKGDRVDIIFTISENEYRDNISINLYIEEII